MKGRGGCVRSFGHGHDFCQAEKAENTDPRTNCAVKYATALRSFEKELADRGVGAKKSFLGERLRPLFCTFLPMPPLGEVDTFLESFLAVF